MRCFRCPVSPLTLRPKTLWEHSQLEALRFWPRDISHCTQFQFLQDLLPSRPGQPRHCVYLLGWPLPSSPLPRLSVQFSSVQFRSVPQSCPTLCDPMNHSTPGLPVHHQLLEFTQTHDRRVGDAIQPSHPLSSPSPPAPNSSQHQSLFQ